jgi:FMN-dependent NADH-azoreductase
MATLLRVDASLRTDGSISRAVADTAADAWRAQHPHGAVVHRDLSAAPLPADAWAQSVGAAYTPQEQWSPDQRAAKELARTLADEVLAADVVVLASPLYNFGVSQYAKVWIDLLITDPRLGPGSTALQGKPALLVVAQGGGYRAGTPRHGWDHATAYLERILGDNFGMSVDTVIADLTLAGINPAMAHLIDAAEQSLAEAHTSATQHGTRLAAAARATAQTAA